MDYQGQSARLPDGADEELQRHRLFLLHELREPKGPGAGSEPARGYALLLARRAPPGTEIAACHLSVSLGNSRDSV